MKLIEADKVEITVIMDNLADWLLEDTQHVKRAKDSKNGIELKVPLMAEHSLCLFISIYKGQERHNILLDTAENGVSLQNNINILNTDLKSIEAIVLSHAHSDHTHGLSWIISQVNPSVPVLAHPDVFLSGRTSMDGNEEIINDCPEIKTITNHGNSIIETRQPYLSTTGLFAVTGQIPRKTDFEKLKYVSYITRNGKKEFDSIDDDQAIVVNIKGKGLLVISGCAHAGIINTVKYCQEITGISSLYGVIGGFHLPSCSKSVTTERTIETLKKMNPEIIVPMHCTGTYAIARFIETFQDKCNLSCVGSTFLF